MDINASEAFHGGVPTRSRKQELSDLGPHCLPYTYISQ